MGYSVGRKTELNEDVLSVQFVSLRRCIDLDLNLNRDLGCDQTPRSYHAVGLDLGSSEPGFVCFTVATTAILLPYGIWSCERMHYRSVANFSTLYKIISLLSIR